MLLKTELESTEEEIEYHQIKLRKLYNTWIDLKYPKQPESIVRLRGKTLG